MEMKQLLTFKEAAESLNFTKTAKKLNFAQSSVTAHIRAIEEHVGMPLFERLGKRLILTEEGKRYKHFAEQMLDLDKASRTALQGEEESSGTLVVGAQESQCTYRLTPILKTFKAKYPNVELIFRPAHSEDMAREQLLDGTLDVAFIMDTAKPCKSLIVERLVEEGIALIASPEHSLHQKKKINAEDLIDETLLLTEAGCSYRNILEHSFFASNIAPANKIEFVSIEAIKQCVIANLGVALLPTMAVENDLKEGRVIQLDARFFTTPVYTHIAWHEDKHLSKPLQAFIDDTRKSFQALVH
ncbi:LysR family transcriptional regulator [Geomicrobium sediminis]|uniref:DNA-binding transcriptional LysR family regulator n=1 Tax=Geomicrobium sediminis TaxID=1347788 RepID=A0ABS2P9X7_9BACL|nr:LysR family transcriptional regulator [Geomicrobium sediminis]MBM7632209.1 DNA-binding transcriptional LysR family regulator [Geomicrobium sediminis]